MLEPRILIAPLPVYSGSEAKDTRPPGSGVTTCTWASTKDLGRTSRPWVVTTKTGRFDEKSASSGATAVKRAVRVPLGSAPSAKLRIRSSTDASMSIDPSSRGEPGPGVLPSRV